MYSLTGKTAIVTGGGSGIGRETARSLARCGANVVIAGRRPEPLEETRRLMEVEGGKVACITADVSRENDCTRLCSEAYRLFGGLDILVNNAGVVDRHIPIVRCDTDWWRYICSVDQDSVFFMCRAALPFLEKSPAASIVNVSSIGGVFGSSGIAYSAAKAAVLGITKNIAIQYSGKNIRCNAVCPGPTPTDINRPEAIASFDQEFMEICNRHLDLSLPCATATNQANAILFFASPASEGITGQHLIVDNGMTL